MTKHPMAAHGIDAVLAADGPEPPGREIGRSREGRPILAHKLGRGPVRVSLVGGCHADEPVGPRFLAKLVRCLAAPSGKELRALATWCVVPHVNPDGARANAAWQPPDAERYDFVAYLHHRRRELPGDDIEFGFPRGPDDDGARPENAGAAMFWRDEGPFHLHVSFHGMGTAAGPYFLVERSWWPRFQPAARRLAEKVEHAGYALHDVERHGEKGFHRLARGFCSRPDSRAMRRHFLELGEPEVAARFRPSSMEAVRALGGDPLTLVTEMPLFLTPGVGEELGPPDPALTAWQDRIAGWEARLRSDEAAEDDDEPVARGLRAHQARLRSAQAPTDDAADDADAAVAREARAAGVEAMAVRDQMRFQWAFVRAGLELVAKELASGRGAGLA